MIASIGKLSSRTNRAVIVPYSYLVSKEEKFRRSRASRASPFLGIIPYNSDSRPLSITVSKVLSSKMSDPLEPTADDATTLFKDLEQKFPCKTLGRDRWYLIAVILSFLFSLSDHLETQYT